MEILELKNYNDKKKITVGQKGEGNSHWWTWT